MSHDNGHEKPKPPKVFSYRASVPSLLDYDEATRKCRRHKELL